MTCSFVYGTVQMWWWWLLLLLLFLLVFIVRSKVDKYLTAILVCHVITINSVKRRTKMNFISFVVWEILCFVVANTVISAWWIGYITYGCYPCIWHFPMSREISHKPVCSLLSIVSAAVFLASDYTACWRVNIFPRVVTLAQSLWFKCTNPR